MHQDATWYGGRPRTRPHYARWGSSFPPPKKKNKMGTTLQFSAHVYCGQTTGWIKMAHGMEIGLSPDHIVLDVDPAPSPLKKRDTAPNFVPISVVAKGLSGSIYHLVRRYRPEPMPYCVRWDPAPPKKGHSSPLFGPCLLWPKGRLSQLLLSTCSCILSALDG